MYSNSKVFIVFLFLQVISISQVQSLSIRASCDVLSVKDVAIRHGSALDAAAVDTDGEWSSWRDILHRLNAYDKCDFIKAMDAFSDQIEIVDDVQYDKGELETYPEITVGNSALPIENDDEKIEFEKLKIAVKESLRSETKAQSANEEVMELVTDFLRKHDIITMKTDGGVIGGGELYPPRVLTRIQNYEKYRSSKKNDFVGKIHYDDGRFTSTVRILMTIHGMRTLFLRPGLRLKIGYGGMTGVGKVFLSKRVLFEYLVTRGESIFKHEEFAISLYDDKIKAAGVPSFALQPLHASPPSDSKVAESLKPPWHDSSSTKSAAGITDADRILVVVDGARLTDRVRGRIIENGKMGQKEGSK